MNIKPIICHYPTLEALRHACTLMPTEMERIHLSALENSWTYLVDVKTMHSVHANEAHMDFERPLWIELSEPIRDELLSEFRMPRFIGNDGVRYDYRKAQGNITAMFFYNPQLECIRLGIEIPTVLTWQLCPIFENGYFWSFFFSYDVKEKKWAPPFTSCSCEDATQVLCERCERTGIKCLNTWKKRFRQALILIQKNRYRPGYISTTH